MLYIVTFNSPMYREDNRILGVFNSEALAEEAIDDYMRTDRNLYPNHPHRYQQNRINYTMMETEVNERTFF